MNIEIETPRSITDPYSHRFARCIQRVTVDGVEIKHVYAFCIDRGIVKHWPDEGIMLGDSLLTTRGKVEVEWNQRDLILTYLGISTTNPCKQGKDSISYGSCIFGLLFGLAIAYFL